MPTSTSSELAIRRGWYGGQALLDDVRQQFTYGPGEDRATGYLDVTAEWLRSTVAKLELDIMRYPVVAFQAYRNGSGCDWHADTPFDAQAILSLGATRTFGVRLLPGAPTWISVHHGDLVYMPSGFQNEWQHCVPVEPDKPGERISLVFRTAAKG
jgi:2OG-Fe(II) oxygenase superfamily